jgi:hypothetical protein
VQRKLGNRPNVISVNRGNSALNDYEQRDEILYGGFPTIFPLACGCGPGNGPLSEEIRRFHLQHFCRRPSINPKYIFYLHDMKQRSDTAKTMKSQVRLNDAMLEKFHDFVTNPANIERIDHAAEHPNSKEASAVLKEINPFINVTSSYIPFSPNERGTKSVTEAYALCRFWGLPNAFITIGFDEKKCSITAKIACMGHAGELRNSAMHDEEFWRRPETFRDFLNLAMLTPDELPAADSETMQPTIIWQDEISNIILEDPVAVTLSCYRILQAFRYALLGLDSSKKKSFANFSSQRRGLFGVGKGDFVVQELTGKKVTHFHKVFWGGLPPWLSQRLGISRKWSEYLTSIFQNVYHATASPILHAAHLLRRQNDIRYMHPGLFTPVDCNLSVESTTSLACANTKSLRSRECVICKILRSLCCCGVRGLVETSTFCDVLIEAVVFCDTLLMIHCICDCLLEIFVAFVRNAPHPLCEFFCS